MNFYCTIPLLQLLKIKCIITTLLFLAFLLLTSGLEAKEPLVMSNHDFIREKGEVSFIGQYSFYNSDHFWNKHGRYRKAYNRLTQHEVALFAEYGLTSCDTIGIYGLYDHNHEELDWGHSGYGDPEVAWKHYLTSTGPYEISSRLLWIIPNEERKTSVNYDRLGVELDLHVQRNFVFNCREGWIEALAGYRYYSGFPSDQIRLNVIAGYQLFSRMRLIGSAYLDYGLFNGHAEYTGPILTLPPRYRLLQAKLHAVIDLTSFASVFVGCSRNVWGINIGTGAQYFTGIWIDF